MANYQAVVRTVSENLGGGYSPVGNLDTLGLVKSSLALGEVSIDDNGVMAINGIKEKSPGVMAFNDGVTADVSGNLYAESSITAMGSITATGNIHANGAINGQCIELFGSIPFIDFHHGGSQADYTSRIVEYSPGVLTIPGILNVGALQCPDRFMGGYSDSSPTRLFTLTGPSSAYLVTACRMAGGNMQTYSASAFIVYTGSWSAAEHTFIPLADSGYYTLSFTNGNVLNVIEKNNYYYNTVTVTKLNH